MNLALRARAFRRAYQAMRLVRPKLLYLAAKLYNNKGGDGFEPRAARPRLLARLSGYLTVFVLTRQDTRKTSASSD